MPSVILIDDDAVVHAAARTKLVAGWIDVVGGSNPYELINLGDYDVAVLDMHLPSRVERGLAHEIKKRGVPVIALTDTASTARLLLRMGDVDAVVLKPDCNQLVAEIYRLSRTTPH